MLLHFYLVEIFCLMLLYMDNMHMMFLHVIKWLYGSAIEWHFMIFFYYFMIFLNILLKQFDFSFSNKKIWR